MKIYIKLESTIQKNKDNISNEKILKRNYLTFPNSFFRSFVDLPVASSKN